MNIDKIIKEKVHHLLKKRKAPGGTRVSPGVLSFKKKSFGEEFFSSEMVIATLDYSSAHVCEALHQFTLLNILHCSKENNNTYKFIVNPTENPECFVEVA